MKRLTVDAWLFQLDESGSEVDNAKGAEPGEPRVGPHPVTRLVKVPLGRAFGRLFPLELARVLEVLRGRRGRLLQVVFPGDRQRGGVHV